MDKAPSEEKEAVKVTLAPHHKSLADALKLGEAIILTRTVRRLYKRSTKDNSDGK